MTRDTFHVADMALGTVLYGESRGSQASISALLLPTKVFTGPPANVLEPQFLLLGREVIKSSL